MNLVKTKSKGWFIVKKGRVLVKSMGGDMEFMLIYGCSIHSYRLVIALAVVDEIGYTQLI